MRKRIRMTEILEPYIGSVMQETSDWIAYNLAYTVGCPFSRQVSLPPSKVIKTVSQDDV